MKDGVLEDCSDLQRNVSVYMVGGPAPDDVNKDGGACARSAERAEQEGGDALGRRSPRVRWMKRHPPSGDVKGMGVYAITELTLRRTDRVDTVSCIVRWPLLIYLLTYLLTELHTQLSLLQGSGRSASAFSLPFTLQVQRSQITASATTLQMAGWSNS